MEDRPWRSSTRSAPVSLTHTRDPSLAASQAEGGAHSRQASGALHSRRGSVAEGRHSRRTSAVIHSRRSTRNSIKFEDEALAEELAPEPINEVGVCVYVCVYRGLVDLMGVHVLE